MARPLLGDVPDLARGLTDGNSRPGDDSGRSWGDTSAPDSCGKIDIRIARDGSWLYHGSPIGRKPMVKLFASVLRRKSDGSYWLVTPAERIEIRVDDSPFVAVALIAEGAGRESLLIFVTNLDEEVNAGPDHPIRVAFDPATGEPTPYVAVRDDLEARIVRSVYYELVARCVEGWVDGRRVLGVWSGGAFFPLGNLPCGT